MTFETPPLVPGDPAVAIATAPAEAAAQGRAQILRVADGSIAAV